MRQISQNYRTGAVRLEQVHAPALRPGGVLVRTHYSVISAGTEGMKVREGRLSYLGKARARPDQVKKVLAAVRQQGVRAAYDKVMNKLDALTPLGYSTCGEVVAVGPGAEEFHVGQRVACAGAGYANHAETNFVPRNLAVAVPEGVDGRHAAFATVGAIAIQGFRQSGMQLGEVACVIGLGLIGQLLVQILRAGGMHVIGVDLQQARCELARSLGATAALTPSDSGLHGAVDRLTGGVGADCVFITAGGSSNVPVELAVELARDRGRIVDIGKTRLDLPWNDYYLKELDVRFSRSYGPGRYDPSYEERGLDYPVGYVRWTEKRNLGAFLQLVAEGRVRLEPLITEVRPFDQAEAAFRRLVESPQDVLGIVFQYPLARADDAAPAPEFFRPAAGAEPRGVPDRVRLGVIGAGNYAASMLLPHLARSTEVELTAVATSSSLSAENARRKFGFRHATTAYRTLLESDDVDAVVIATRHASHARLALEALQAGKAVYLEKPLALSVAELMEVCRAVRATGNGRLMVGFNRRFAPLVSLLAGEYAGGRQPLVLSYRVHAGRLEPGSWYLDPSEGSRFAGEAGHFFDLMAYFAAARPVSVTAHALRPAQPTPDDLENVVVSVRYANGGVGNLLYLTQGGARVPKEYLEAFGNGRTLQLHNFEHALCFDKAQRRRIRGRGVDKGQKQMLAAFIAAVRSGGPMPIDLQSLHDTTLLTLAALHAAANGGSVSLEAFGRTAAAADAQGEQR